MMPNGFNIYDYDILDDETDEDLLLTSNSLFNYESYLDCVVCAISPDPLDTTLTAFYISTVDLRIKAGISVKEFENLVKSERKA